MSEKTLEERENTARMKAEAEEEARVETENIVRMKAEAEAEEKARKEAEDIARVGFNSQNARDVVGKTGITVTARRAMFENNRTGGTLHNRHPNHSSPRSRRRHRRRHRCQDRRAPTTQHRRGGRHKATRSK